MAADARSNFLCPTHRPSPFCSNVGHSGGPFCNGPIIPCLTGLSSPATGIVIKRCGERVYDSPLDIGKYLMGEVFLPNIQYVVCLGDGIHNILYVCGALRRVIKRYGITVYAKLS